MLVKFRQGALCRGTFLHPYGEKGIDLAGKSRIKVCEHRQSCDICLQEIGSPYTLRNEGAEKAEYDWLGSPKLRLYEAKVFYH